jgi:hypothetical protein
MLARALIGNWQYFVFDDNVKSSVITEKNNTTKFEILLTFDPSPEFFYFDLFCFSIYMILDVPDKFAFYTNICSIPRFAWRRKTKNSRFVVYFGKEIMLARALIGNWQYFVMAYHEHIRFHQCQEDINEKWVCKQVLNDHNLLCSL